MELNFLPVQLDQIKLRGGITIGGKLRLCQRTLDRLWEYYSELMRVEAPGMEGFTQEDFDALALSKVEEAFEDILSQLKKRSRYDHEG